MKKILIAEVKILSVIVALLFQSFSINLSSNLNFNLRISGFSPHQTLYNQRK